MLLGLALSLPGCSLRKMALRSVADTLAEPGSAWSSDDDPELVGEALPFALKTQESLLAELPEHRGLLLGACRGFVSYASGWIEPRAEALESDDFEAARAVRDRALRLDLRARDYCLRALELAHPGVSEGLRLDPESALGDATRAEVELLYWTGAAWGSAVSLGLDRPELVADLPAVRRLFRRALELDPGFDRGALEEAMVAIEAVPELLGGSPGRAGEHYRRALELSGGARVSPYVTYARTVLVAKQDRRGFRETLERALAVDLEASPPDRLANRLAQRRARALLARVDDLFYEGEE